MDAIEIFQKIFHIVKPVKSIFAFYILMYVVPVISLLSIILNVKDEIVIPDTSEINIAVLLLVVFLLLLILAWTTFFLIYFTRERTRNPRLYNKGFISGFEARGEKK